MGTLPEMRAAQSLGRSSRAAIRIAPGRGRLLPEEVRRKAEALFGEDFTGVRVHVGPWVRDRGAVAMTSGSAIHFAPGAYDPTSARGLRLLGHELAHVVQQRSGSARSPHPYGVIRLRDPELELAADRMGAELAARCDPRAPAVQRMEEKPLPTLPGTHLHLLPLGEGLFADPVELHVWRCGPEGCVDTGDELSEEAAKEHAARLSALLREYIAWANHLPGSSGIQLIGAREAPQSDAEAEMNEDGGQAVPEAVLATNDKVYISSGGAGPCVVLLIRLLTDVGEVLGAIHLSADDMESLEQCTQSVNALLQEAVRVARLAGATKAGNRRAYLIGAENPTDDDDLDALQEIARALVTVERLQFNLLGANLLVNGGNQFVDVYMSRARVLYVHLSR